MGAGFYIEAAYAVILLMFAVNLVPHLIRSLGPEVLNKHEVSVRIIMEANFVLTEVIQKSSGLRSARSVVLEVHPERFEE